jgi:hypothetical protein
MIDGNGVVQFTTIYPGWYDDKAIFTYMSRSAPLRGQTKHWNGHHSFTLTTLSMNWST